MAKFTIYNNHLQIIIIIISQISYPTFPSMDEENKNNPQNPSPIEEQVKDLSNLLSDLSLRKKGGSDSFNIQLEQFDYPSHLLGSDSTFNNHKNPSFINNSDQTAMNPFLDKKINQHALKHRSRFNEQRKEEVKKKMPEEKLAISHQKIISKKKQQQQEKEQIKSPSKTKPIQKQASHSKNKQPKKSSSKTHQKRQSKPKTDNCSCNQTACGKSNTNDRIYCKCALVGRRCTTSCKCADCQNFFKPVDPYLIRNVEIPVVPYVHQLLQSNHNLGPENYNQGLGPVPVMEFEQVIFSTKLTEEISSTVCKCKEGCVRKTCPCFYDKIACGSRCGCVRVNCKNVKRV